MVRNRHENWYRNDESDLQIAESRKRGSRALSRFVEPTPGTQMTSFQDYDVVYIVKDPEDLISDFHPGWISVVRPNWNRATDWGHRRSYLMPWVHLATASIWPSSQVSLSKSGWTAKQILKL